jgi:transglutaminase-like putative cysteine protease
MQKDTMYLMLILAALVAIWLVCGPASGMQYTDSTGTIHVVDARAAYLKQPGDTPEIAAERLRGMAPDDGDYIAAAYQYALINVIQPAENRGWIVKNPQRSLDDGTGDCSERALLIVAMLGQYGIDARVIYGTVPGIGLHDTVEIHRNKYISRIDAADLPTFFKLGDGMHPDEKIV